MHSFTVPNYLTINKEIEEICAKENNYLNIHILEKKIFLIIVIIVLVMLKSKKISL